MKAKITTAFTIWTSVPSTAVAARTVTRAAAPRPAPRPRPRRAGCAARTRSGGRRPRAASRWPAPCRCPRSVPASRNTLPGWIAWRSATVACTLASPALTSTRSPDCTPIFLASEGASSARCCGGQEAQRGRVLGHRVGPDRVGQAQAQALGQLGRGGQLAGGQLGTGQLGRGVAVLPAHAGAADGLQVDARVEGHRGGQLRGQLGRRQHVQRRAAALGQLGQHAPLGPRLALVADGLAHALEPAVGVGQGALLLRPGLGGEDHGGVLGQASVANSAKAITCAAQAPPPSGRAGPGWVTSGSACSSTSVDRSPSIRPSAICVGGAARGGRVGQARAQVRQHAGLAQAARVGRLGHLDQAGLGLALDAERGGHRQQRVHRGGAAVAVGHALAPEDHHVAGVLEQLGRGGDRARLGAGARAQPRAVGARRAQLGGQRGQRGVGGAGRVAHAGAVGVQRAGAAGQRDQLGVVAAHGLAHAQVQRGHLVHQLGLHHQHHVGVVDVADARGQVGPRQHARLLGVQRAAGARVQVRRAQAPGGTGAGGRSPPRWWCCARRPARRPTSPALVSALAASSSARSHDTSRSVAAVAHHRRAQALGRVHGLVAEAALVAQPAVVHLVVLAVQHAQHLRVVAHRVLHVALARAERAHRARALDVPRARAEAVGGRGQRAHRAQLDDVAAERAHVRAAVVGAHVGVVAALEEHQLVVLGHLLGEAHAAVTEDAALAVDGHQRAQLQRLLEVALGLDVARLAAAPAVGDVLQRALAALVAHRAVQRVVDQQELHHRLLRLLDAVGGGVHHHALADGRGARGLQLGDALDLDQAHAAGAHGLAQLGLVTEVGDLHVAATWRRPPASCPRAR